MNHRNRSVDVHQFAMVPRADIPRSSFRMETSHKTAFDAGYLVPIYVDEVLPGDTFNLQMTAFARLATPIFPFMDNVYLDTFFFFVPYRLLWTNWQRFMGERDPDPDSSIDYVVPYCSLTGGEIYDVGSLQDYFGLPTTGMASGGTGTWTHSALPLRAYNLIYNEWFRDENLQDSVPKNVGDGPDSTLDYTLLRRGKRHDYFTSCLPWTQKGDSVSLPLGTVAPVITGATEINTYNAERMYWKQLDNTHMDSLQDLVHGADNSTFNGSATGLAQGGSPLVPSNLYADLSEATAATINQLRQAFQIQRLLERDARGGTRYTELVRSHFGVISPDARLQRPEYLGGGSTPISVNPVAQTSSTDTETPQGNLAAFATGLARSGFTQSFTEHGVVIGLVSVRADLNYQQGIRRMWSRQTRFDFYWPVFAMLGEQAVLNKELYFAADTTDEEVFGYQERWAEYRYHPAMITGLMRSTAASSIDAWHLAQEFSALPALNSSFIQENPPLDRVLAVGSEANGQQIIFDSFFSIRAARPLPMYSVPGLIDHF